MPVLLLAALARGRLRLWAFAMVGVVLALGSYGPLGLLPRDLSFPLRGPQKLVFLSHLALALLAGFGIESRLGEGSRGVLSRRWSLVLPGAIAAALALAVGVAPQVVRLSAARVIPELLDDRGAVVARATWPVAWLPAGALTLGAGLALALGGRWVRVAAVVVAIDLLIVNGRVNPLAPASFYDLRPDLARLVGQARDGARMFSYGVARTPGLRFEPIMTRAPSDVWLYYLDRQSLLPVTCVLDGMDAAPDEDRTGWAPLGAALTSGAVVPSRFREHHRQLRLAGVGWVLSFAEIPEDLSIIRGRQKLPEVAAPLTLFELRDALPRAFYVAERRIEPDAAQAAAILAGPDFDPARTVLLASDRHSPPPLAHAWRAAPVVRYQPVDAHTLRITARTPPGYIVVLDGYHPDWRADDGLGPVPVLRADGRYRAIPTPGGAHTFTMRFRPSWRLPALLACAVGCLALVLLFLLGRVELRGDPASAHARLAAEG